MLWARPARLRGATIDLCGPRGPTVTGTANVLCAAVLARGRTVIRGAACEPEIVDLGRMLNSLGARICGLGTPIIEIEGVERLGGGSYRIIPDRIEAATLMLAAAITGGGVNVVGVVPEHLQTFLATLEASGISIDVQADRVTVRASGRPLAGERGRRTVPGPADRSSSPLDGIHGDGGWPKSRRGPRLSHALGARGRIESTGRRICTACPAA